MSKKRVYPQGSIVGHITGYTGMFSKIDIKNGKMISVPGLEIGKSGLEKFFDIELRGEFGRKRNEVTSKGHVIDSQIYEDSKPGNDLQFCNKEISIDEVVKYLLDIDLTSIEKINLVHRFFKTSDLHR